MTPEELAVVQAAMAWRDMVLAHPEALHQLHNAGGLLTPVLNELSRTTYALAVACPDCNTGRHICPGDGESIPHGANDCGGHGPALIWVERTWTDVRSGDMVRLVGSDTPPALVHSAVHLPWHVDPRSSGYQPTPLEWSAVHVTLGDAARAYDMDPAKPVLIEIDEAALPILDTLGWENREPLPGT